MNYKTVISHENGVLVTEIQHLQLDETLDNGQAFRWEQVGDDVNHFRGIAFDRFVTMKIVKDDLYIEGITPEEFDRHWKAYLDLETDYGAIKKAFSHDDTLRTAMAYAPGVRVLRQDPWEVIATFILTQNNNIKRIKGLVARFCQEFGPAIDGGYGFPTAETIAQLTVEDLAPVRAGFRAKYLVDAAEKVADGTVSLSLPFSLPIDEAREHLMQIFGVGPKVADCALLFGFHRIESFPKDVWIKRALDHFYPEGFPPELQPWAGIAQQYLFHYTRLNPHVLPEKDNKKR